LGVAGNRTPAAVSARAHGAPASLRAPMEYALALILLAALVVLAVTIPLRRRGEEERREEIQLEELRAAKEAKYREIRDAELDHRMGKLSQADWREVDRELRGEAIVILRELDRLEGRPPEGP
jgi:hypothetical protein